MQTTIANVKSNPPATPSSPFPIQVQAGYHSCLYHPMVYANIKHKKQQKQQTTLQDSKHIVELFERHIETGFN